MKELAIDAVEIEDAPRFGYRGLMLDVGRNFHSKETVKKLLELMAFYKLNRFHWHLSDDEGWRIEIKALPELTAIGSRRGHTKDESDRLVPSLGSGPSAEATGSGGTGFYSQDDFIEVLRFANERHIEVIPEFDVPGHSRAAVIAMAARARRLIEEGKPEAAGEFLLTDPGDKSKYESVQMWHGNVLDVGRDATYRFVNEVIGELADMYRRAGVPLTTIHLGGDEVPEGAWLASPACEGIATTSDAGPTRGQQLQLHFLDRGLRDRGEARSTAGLLGRLPIVRREGWPNDRRNPGRIHRVETDRLRLEQRLGLGARGCRLSTGERGIRRRAGQCNQLVF